MNRGACSPDKTCRMPGNDEWVRPYLKKYKGVLFAAIALGVAAEIFACALMFTSGFMISLAGAIPLTVLTLHLPSIFVRIFGIGKPILRYTERLKSHDWALRMTSEMRRKLFLVLARKRTDSKISAGDMLSFLNDDIGHVQNLIIRGVLPFLIAWTLSFAIAVVCGVLSWELFGVMACMLVICAVVSPLLASMLNAADIAREKACRQDVYSSLADSFFGITDWKLSGRKRDYIEYISEACARRERARMGARRRTRVINFASQTVFCICVVCVILWAAAVFSTDTASTAVLSSIANSGSENAPAYAPNWIAAFTWCLFPLLEVFSPLTGSANEFLRQRDSLSRLNRFSSESEESKKHAAGRKTDKTSGSCDRQPKPDRRETARILDELANAIPSIAIENLSFSYEKACDTEYGEVGDEVSHKVLNRMNLEIPPGQKVAICGKSGAGKSTLANLLSGNLRIQTGRILFDGYDSRIFGDEIWRIVGSLEQSPRLFKMSLRDNLTLGRDDIEDSRIMDTLHKVGLTERMGTMPKGLDSQIEEGAFNLSGGEAHRVALARILLADQPIVILDEPFASLDSQTASLVADTVFDVLRDKTLITVTHDTESLDRFDRIISL